MNNSIDISIIIPLLNEGESVHVAYECIKSEMQKHNNTYEIIFVDDGSVDDSFYHLNQIAEKDPNLRIIKLASNCGSHMAIRAGLFYAKGECACFIACDMQEPPELIPQMRAMINDQCHVVWSVRNSRKDTFLKKLFASAFYLLARIIATKDVPPSGASMFMISRKVIQSVNLYSERNLTLVGLFASIGFKSNYIYYDGKERIAGKSKWTLGKKIKLFIDFFVASSYTPIRFVSLMGIVFSLLGFAWTAYIILRELLYRDMSPGWPALISVLLIGFGVTNISLGIIAEYLWRTLDEARRRPKFIIEKTVNLENKIQS